MQFRANSDSIQNTQTESSYRTLSDLAKFKQIPPESSYQTLSDPIGFYPVQSDIVWSGLDIVWSSKFSQRLVPFELSIYSPTPPTGISSWPVDFTVFQAHFLHSKGLKHSILEHSL
jgi:hypothetical protein